MIRLEKTSNFDFKVDFEAKKSIKKTLWLPHFKELACKSDFLSLHESKFAAYFTGWQILRLEKSVKVDF